MIGNFYMGAYPANWHPTRLMRPPRDGGLFRISHFALAVEPQISIADGVGIPQDGNHYTLGPWLTFDPQTEQHTGEHARAANALLKDTNRPGFEIPTAAQV